MKKRNLKIKLSVVGQEVELVLFDGGISNQISRSGWTDKRDLSKRVFIEMEKMFIKNNLVISDIKDFYFDCDSPYFQKDKKNAIMGIEEVSSSGKCGFTSWQTGQVIMEVLNFSVRTS